MLPPPALHLHHEKWLTWAILKPMLLTLLVQKFCVYFVSTGFLSPGQLALIFPYRALSSAEAPSLLAGG